MTEGDSTTAVFHTAASLDGFLADERDSLSWLFAQEGVDPETGAPPEGDPLAAFMAGVGAIVMGATTYRWLASHLEASGVEWPYQQPTFVFTHHELPPLAANITFIEGAVADQLARIRTAADSGDLWIVGGGDLAAQFAEIGALDQLVVTLAPVTLGAGRPLFPRRWQLRLVDQQQQGPFLHIRYDVVGPGAWSE